MNPYLQTLLEFAAGWIVLGSVTYLVLAKSTREQGRTDVLLRAQEVPLIARVLLAPIAVMSYKFGHKS